jgi:YHS domain-containing protein
MSNIIEFIILNPILQIFYFGVFSGVLLMYVKDNAPNRIDVFIGKRIGNILRIFKHKTPPETSQSMDFKGGTYYFDSADIKLEFKHGPFVRSAFIFDEDNATPIKTTKPNEPTTEKKEETTITKNGKQTTLTTLTKTKSKNYPLDIQLDTQWHISARKLYNWWKNRMMETTWRAIIGKTIGSDYFVLILGITLGAIIGGLAVYSIIPYHVIASTITTTTNSSQSTITSTTSSLGTITIS